MKSSKLAIKFVIVCMIMLIVYQVMVRNTSGFGMVIPTSKPRPKPAGGISLGTGIILPSLGSSNGGISLGTGISLPGITRK